MTTPTQPTLDVPALLTEIEDEKRDADSHVIPYAFNWLTDPGRPLGSCTEELDQCDQVASMFAVSVLHIAAERDSLRASLARCEQERDALATRQQELLVTIRNLSSSVPYAEESTSAATLIAEVGTLKARLRNVEAQRNEAQVGLAHFAESRTAIAIDMASKLADMTTLRDQAAAAERSACAAWIESIRDNGMRSLAASIRAGQHSDKGEP